jgi:hypothetical protein
MNDHIKEWCGCSARGGFGPPRCPAKEFAFRMSVPGLWARSGPGKGLPNQGGAFMKSMKAVLGFLMVVFLAGAVGAVAAQETVTEDVEGKAKLLKGTTWVQMMPESKLAFIWGMGHVAEIEQELMKRHPELDVENFSAKIIEGMADVPMNNIVEAVDEYYETNPDKLQEHVVKVIWDVIIKPNIQTGIAGQPLK